MQSPKTVYTNVSNMIGIMGWRRQMYISSDCFSLQKYPMLFILCCLH